MCILLLINILLLTLMCTKRSTEFCIYKNVKNDYAYCARDATNQTLDYIPRVTANITTINMYGQPLRHLPYNAFQNLTSVRIISNVELLFCRISYVNVGAFLNLDNVNDLTLSFNEIRNVDSKTFQHVRHVKNIYLAGNYIEILRKGLFSNLPHLQGVHLGYNNIRAIESGTFANTPALQYIVLSNNQLQHLDTSFLDTSHKLTSLFLHENPWICDSNLKALYNMYITLEDNAKLTYMPTCFNQQENQRSYWNETFKPYLDIIEPSNETIWLNEGSVILVCKVYGFPKPNIRWQQASTVIVPGTLSIYVGNDTYYLNYTVSVDKYAKEYHCIASNTNITKQASVTIYLSNMAAMFKSYIIYLILIAIAGVICFILQYTYYYIQLIWERKKNHQDNALMEFEYVSSNLLQRNSEEDVNENQRNRLRYIDMNDLQVNN